MRVLLEMPFQEMLSVGWDGSDEIVVTRTKTVKQGGFGLLSTAPTGVPVAVLRSIPELQGVSNPLVKTRVFPSCGPGPAVGTGRWEAPSAAPSAGAGFVAFG